MNVQRRLPLSSSFRSADDEAAEACLGGMISVSTESQTESRKQLIKAGTIVTLGISLLLHTNSPFWEKEEHLYGESVVVVMGEVVEGGVAEVQGPPGGPLPDRLIPNKSSMSRKPAEKTASATLAQKTN